MFIDLIATLLILYGFYIGYSRGIIKTIFALVSIMIGILAALKLSPYMIDLLQGIFKFHPGLTFIVGFALTFILVLIVIRFLGKKLEDILKFAQINFINKVLGGGVMAILFLVFYSYTLWGIDSLSLLSQNSKNTSMSYDYLETLPSKTQDTVAKFKPFFDNFWNKLVDTFDNIKEYEKKVKEGN